jgi:endoglycosylceramidase
MRSAIVPLVALGLGACSTSSATPKPPTRDAAATSTKDATSRDARDAKQARDVDEAGPTPPGPALPLTPIGHEGRWLTDAEGRVVLVHGVNVVNKDPPYYPSAQGFSHSDAVWLADSGFRVVRVGILATGLMPTPGVVDMGYVQQIVATVKDLATQSIFSIIDLHQDGWGPTLGSDGFPAWMTLTGSAVSTDASFPLYYQQNPAIQQAFQSFWDNATGPDGKGIQDDYAAMFGAVATALASEPYVLGYDLFNEPWPGTTYNACVSGTGCPNLDTGELGPAYAKAVTAIRAAGDQHLIFGEPFVLFNFGLVATSIPIPGADSNAGMAFHVYPLSAADAPSVISQAVTWSTSTGGALLNTEWGATESASVLTSESLALDSAFVPWIFWSFCCELISTFDGGPGGQNLVATTAAALIQPYPLAVAGKPETLTLDPSTQTLSFTWSTSRVGGGHFAAGTVTTFEAPTFTYPKGYKVTVSGGSVTSAACAPLLTVEAKPAAEAVSVKIEPAGSCP